MQAVNNPKFWTILDKRRVHLMHTQGTLSVSSGLVRRGNPFDSSLSLKDPNYKRGFQLAASHSEACGFLGDKDKAMKRLGNYT